MWNLPGFDSKWKKCKKRELKRYRDTVTCEVPSAEVPVHGQVQLTQTLIVSLVPSFGVGQVPLYNLPSFNTYCVTKGWEKGCGWETSMLARSGLHVPSRARRVLPGTPWPYPLQAGRASHRAGEEVPDWPAGTAQASSRDAIVWEDHQYQRWVWALKGNRTMLLTFCGVWRS